MRDIEHLLQSDSIEHIGSIADSRSNAACEMCVLPKRVPSPEPHKPTHMIDPKIGVPLTKR